MQSPTIVSSLYSLTLLPAVEHADELFKFKMVLVAEHGAVNDMSKHSQLPGNPLYHWPISRDCARCYI